MNVEAIEKSIQGFIKKHKSSLYAVGLTQSKALELGATVGVSEHYRSNGYDVEIENPKSNPSSFVVKTSTRGHPWNFSRIHLERDGNRFELHMNLMVRSAHDEGIYCVDVGIAKPESVPSAKTQEQWICIENKSLISFSEVKKLVVYPMLLAQFIGIVHEIKPSFIGGRLPNGFKKQSHLAPSLISLGTFSGNSRKIVDALSGRKINITIFENFDVRIANLRAGHVDTPFYKGDIDEV